MGLGGVTCLNASPSLYLLYRVTDFCVTRSDVAGVRHFVPGCGAVCCAAVGCYDQPETCASCGVLRTLQLLTALIVRIVVGAAESPEAEILAVADANLEDGGGLVVCPSPVPLFGFKDDLVQLLAAQPSFIALSSNWRQATRSCSTRSRRSRSASERTGLGLDERQQMPSSSVSTKR